MAYETSTTKNSGERITVRFGDAILQEGFTSVPNLILNHYSMMGISQAEMLFIIHVWQFWWSEKNPYPALTTVAERMNIGLRQVRNYVQSLKTKGFAEREDLHVLVVHERYESGKGQVTNEYDFSGLIEAVVLISQGQSLTPRKDLTGEGRKNITGAPRNAISAEEDKEQEDEKTRRIHSNIRMRTRAELNVDNSGSNGDKPHRNGASHHAAGEENTHHQPSTTSVAPADSAHPQPPRRVPGEIESVGTVLKRGRGRPPKQPYDEDRQQILAYIQDFAREMGDKAPLTASVSRAYNLYKTSGRPIARFVDAMYQARAKTKERSAHIKSAPDSTHPFAPKAKMAYYFALLEDELGLREDEAHAAALNRAMHPSRSSMHNDPV